MILREWSSDIPGVRGTNPGNSQRGVVGHQFPRRRQRRSWRPGIIPDAGVGWSWGPGITPDTGVGVVLEAWCYTRVGWDRFDPRGGGWISGNSRLCSSVQIPRNVATTGSMPTAARGVDIQRRCHQYQGSVGDGSDWCTGIQSSHEVINLHFVYTLVTV